MPLIEVQPRSELAAGTYEGVVASVAKDIIVPRQGKNAGQDVPILRWVWHLPGAAADGGDEPIESITGRDPTSEKSNLFKYFVALIGPNRQAWETVEQEDLVGRKALVTVGFNDDNYPRVDAVSAMLVKRQPQPMASEQVAANAARPIDTNVSPLREAEAAPTALPDPAGDDDLPF